MAQWITLQDVTPIDPTVGSLLYGGSKIYCYVTQIQFGGGNNVGYKPIQGVNTEINSEDTDVKDNYGLMNNYDRRIGFNSYASFNNPTITLTGDWLEDVGSIKSIGSILTPQKLFRMVHSDHQFLINGGTVIASLRRPESNEGCKEGSPAYYIDYTGGQDKPGIPVVFTSPWAMNEVANQESFVTWNATLRIDRMEN